MKVTILEYPTDKDWQMVYNICRSTMKKLPIEEFSKTKEISIDWKKRLLNARHSPIRRLQFTILIEDVKHWVHVHYVRHHIGVTPFVTTSRNDRQGEFDRDAAPQDHPTTFILYCNADALINIVQKRLCGKCSPETREVAKEIKNKVLETNPEFKSVLVQPCVYNRVCHEMQSCEKQR